MNKEEAAYWRSHGHKDAEAASINVFSYSLWSGQFIVKEVTLYPRIDKDGYDRSYIKAKSGTTTQTIDQEGVWCNGVVWFKERNDLVASTLLLEHVEQSIVKLKETIEKYEYKISLIKQGVIEK
jgi:hypothetical protein